MNKLTMKSTDLTQVNIDKIAELFPNVITEARDEQGKIKRAVDFDLLRQELSDYLVEGEKERYQLTWPGKKEAIILANTSIDKTLRPVKENSVNWENTQNLYLEGDNLEVLKLLQESYLNKIKLVYIDPPYNTGKDFIYKDDYKESAEEYLEESGQIDDEGNKLFQNTESNGRFHSDWLTMMYSRLKIARNLLSEDGAIFISIDDNEIINVRRLCDHVFGESNFFAQVIVQSNKRGHTYKQISKTHEYLLIYTKNPDTEFNELEKTDENFDLNYEDELGKFNIRELRNRNPKFGKFNRPNLFYSVYVNESIVDSDGFSPVSLNCDEHFTIGVTPLNSIGGESCWRWGKQLLLKNSNVDTKKSNVVAKKKRDGGFNIYEKYRKSTYTPKSIWTETEFITEKGTVELGELGLSKYFDFPKPTHLIRQIIELSCGKEDIVLDFFSGSATTADAVMKLNAEDEGNRKYIMIQVPQKTNENSDAFKDGYLNICEIGKERIRRAAKKIKEETGADIDYGFRVYRVDSSNMKDVYYTPDSLGQLNLDDVASNIKEDRTGEDLLIQVILECGLELSLPMESKEIQGKTVHYVAGNSLIACFDDEVSESVIKKIAEDQPLRVVFRDSSFSDDSARINVEELFKLLSPSTEIQVL
ncbi:site-specific DNA-methyltransferase [Paenibacillus motobuensis]|uniref:Site-specific DNA-methyltransferase n=1 Tax=Paenibacillus motobuensis TaxID=295324 RepID=A0ABP3IHV1_9BACL